jgi:predicted small secreted protein
MTRPLLIIASLLLCVLALNGCTSPVKPVGQAVSSQPLASIMPPGVVVLVMAIILK